MRPELAKENVKLHDKNSPIIIGSIKETDRITIAKNERLIEKYNQNEQFSLI